MPKLWTETIAAHRRVVREAILDTTAALVAEHGLRAVTMSQIAEEAGIGRATLYKYFSDVDTILVAWHERQVSDHLEQLMAVGTGPGDPGTRLEAVLATYARIAFAHHGSDLALRLHRGAHVDRAHQHLSDFLCGLLAEGAAAGAFRDDVPPEELATYCLHALAAAGSLPSADAVQRLVSVTLAGVRAPGAWQPIQPP